MKVIKVSLYSVFMLIGILGSGCKKLIQIPPSLPNTISTQQVFADSLTAMSGVLGIYVNNFSSLSMLSGLVTYYPGLSADELVTYADPDAIFYNNALSANNAVETVDLLWVDSYNATLIYQANAAIEGLEASKTLTTSLKNQLIGECKVIRALTYFNLTNLFDAVPLALTSTVATNNKLARVSQDSVYSFLFNDLTDAINRLPATYPSPGRARPNKYTAMALLAKLQLYRKLWSSAEASSTVIIQSGLYALEPDLNNVFLNASQEAIWQITGDGFTTFATVEGDELLPSAADVVPTITINPYLMSAFEANDTRKIKWISSNTVDGETYHFPYKYKNTDYAQNGSTVESYMVFRLAEQYLIRAEARIELGKLTDGAADLNIIRKRAGLPNTTATTQADLLKAVMHERQTELFCEWGNRWYDLKRTGNVNTVLNVEKAGIWPGDGHAALYPIPGDQIKLDPALTQNPGY